MTTESTSIDSLKDLEEGLWRPETRHDRDWLNGVLAPDFVEYCRFGNIHERDDIIDAPAQDVEVLFPFSDFHAEMLAPDVAFVTYVNTITYQGKTQCARRSSIWIHSEKGWKLKFQQATTLPD